MHAYLVVGEGDLFQRKINELSEGFFVQKYSLQKIADVKELSKITKLTLTQKTAFLVESFELASEEAQNAFLKNLEEPQENLLYILTARQIQTVLATIVSRCTLIEVLSKRTDTENEKLAQEFINADIGNRFLIISKITDRVVAISFIESLLIELGKNLPDKRALEISEKAFKTLENIKKNGNISLQLANLVVQIS